MRCVAIGCTPHQGTSGWPWRWHGASRDGDGNKPAAFRAVECDDCPGASAPRIHRGLSALAWRDYPFRTAGKESGASLVTLTVGPASPRPKKPAPSLLQGVRGL